MMVLGVTLAGACGFFASSPEQHPVAISAASVFGVQEVASNITPRGLPKAAPLVAPADSEGLAVYRAAKRFKGAKILVSPILLFGVDAPAVSPSERCPGGSQSRVITSGASGCSSGLWRMVPFSVSMHEASAM